MLIYNVRVFGFEKEVRIRTRILHPVSPECRGSKEGVRVGLM